MFPRVTEAECVKTIKDHIKLKMYNKTVLAQLGTCTLIIYYKDNKKKCEFFVVPRNGQELLGMPDTATLNIIYVNIHSIEAASTQKENCITNIRDTKNPNTKQETHGVKESCTNTDRDLQNANNVKKSNNNTNTNTLKNYFLSSPNIEVERRRKSIELTQEIHNVFDNVLMALGALKAHFHCSSSLIVSPIKYQ